MVGLTPDIRWRNPSGYVSDVYRLVPLEKGQAVTNGIGLFLDALAIRVADRTFDLKNPRDSRTIVQLVSSQIPVVREADLSLRHLKAIIGRGSTISGPQYARQLFDQSDDVVLLRLMTDLKSAIDRERIIKPLLVNIPKVMIAGMQGSGKDSLAPILSQLGYQFAPMSDLVKMLCYSERYNQNNTQSKIDMGNALRKVFGEGILVELAIRHLARQPNVKRMAILGPRTMGEVEAALNMNSKLIGIVADLDPEKDRQIRFARIVQRAETDSSRRGDIDAFPTREEIEKAKISQILRDPRCSLIVNGSSLDNLYENALSLIS